MLALAATSVGERRQSGGHRRDPEGRGWPDSATKTTTADMMNAMTVTVKTARRTGAGVYARLVDEVREVLTAGEVARVTGVSERQVHHWRAGETRPRGEARERLLELHYLIGGLREVYTPEGVEVFWHGRNRDLGGRRPLELAEAGEFDALVELVGQLRDSNF